MKHGSFSIALLFNSWTGISIFSFLTLTLATVAVAGFFPAIHLWELASPVRWAIGIGVAINALIFIPMADEEDPRDPTRGIGPLVMALVPLYAMVSTFSEPSMVLSPPRWPLWIGSGIALALTFFWGIIATMSLWGCLVPDPMAQSFTPD